MQRIRAWAVAGVLGAASLTAASAGADEPVEPLTYDLEGHPEPGSRSLTAIAGLGVTTAWYGAALGSSYLFPDAPGSASLQIPVAGPWMALAKTGCPAREPDCSTFTTVVRAILTTLNGIGQAGGILVASESLFLETAEPRNQPRKPPQSASITSVDAAIVEDGWVFSVAGEF